jgi:hypothetical protein
METPEPESVIATWDGMARIATSVHLPFKGDNAMNANAAGRDPTVTSVIRAILDPTVMYVRRAGFLKPIV